MRITAVIVVFRQVASETPSYISVDALRSSTQKLRVIIWDNSPDPQPASMRNDTDTYVSTPENLGLSEIYNRVRSNHLDDTDYVLLLDQDSTLPKDFLRAWELMYQRYPEVDLFLPMVRANNRWVSPLSYLWGWGRYWKHPRTGRIKSQHCMAINSGMIVRANYFKEEFTGYDERLKFYGTDTQFMVQYATKRPTLCILNTVIEHDLSFFSGSRVGRLEKFLSMRNGYRYIYEQAPLSTRLAVGLVMLAVSALYAIRFRSIKYLSA